MLQGGSLIPRLYAARALGCAGKALPKQSAATLGGWEGKQGHAEEELTILA